MSNYKFKLKNVRLSFPSIFKRSTFDSKEGKFEATFLISKEQQKDLIKEIEAKIALIQKDNKAKVSPDKICFKDGDFVDYDGYEGHMSIKAGANRRPTVIDRDKTPLVEDDGKPYAGCYVNAVLELWYQDNSYGKRVNCNLLGIQFSKDGDSFGAGDTDVTDDFDDEDDMLG